MYTEGEFRNLKGASADKMNAAIDATLPKHKNVKEDMAVHVLACVKEASQNGEAMEPFRPVFKRIFTDLLENITLNQETLDKYGDWNQWADQTFTHRYLTESN